MIIEILIIVLKHPPLYQKLIILVNWLQRELKVF